jgi:redox-sensing transcriptional repressor
MANGSMRTGIPPTVIRRLPKYLAHLQALRLKGVEWVPSHDLAEGLGLTSSTVRQDLSYLEFSGTSKRGYGVQGLTESLAAVLGADTEWKVVIVGAGNLGRALALHEDFARHRFTIKGLFDKDARKIGKRVGQLVVRNVEEMPRFVADQRVSIGVIAVPAAAAQSVADLLILAGISGILNMARTHLLVPNRVAIVESRIIDSMQELSHAIIVKSP